MTTQENIAKHLGVNLNEPFKVAEWNHPILHVDPNMGVVTKDGDRLSSVLLQELLFGKIIINKLGKQKFNFSIKPYHFHLSNSDINSQLKFACIKLESLDSHLCYHDAISDIAAEIAYKFRSNLSLVQDLKEDFDDYIERAVSIKDVNNLYEFVETVLNFAIYTIIEQEALQNIVYNMLTKYIKNTGLNTIKSEQEIGVIIMDISNIICVDDTPQDCINILIERTENNGQNSENSN